MKAYKCDACGKLYGNPIYPRFDYETDFLKALPATDSKVNISLHINTRSPSGYWEGMPDLCPSCIDLLIDFALPEFKKALRKEGEKT